MKRRHETPIKRAYASGKSVWVARWTDRNGRLRYGHPDVNGGQASYDLRREAQEAIDGCYDAETKAPREIGTVGGYLPVWLERHPRSERTNATNEHRIGRVLDVLVEGKPFREWELHAVRRRHIHDLVSELLVVQGRAHTGAQNILRALSAMFEDAISDDYCDANPVLRVTVRATDPRVQKRVQAKPIFSFAEMHVFAGEDAMLRCFTDLGLRLGEVLGLYRADLAESETGWHLTVRRTAHEGVLQDGTKTSHGEATPGRTVPVPPTLLRLIQGEPRRIDTPLLFPTSSGKVWRERNFYRDIWNPEREWFGKPITPQRCRASWESYLAAAGIGHADLAAVAGHTIETAMGSYLQATKQSYDAIRGVIG